MQVSVEAGEGLERRLRVELPAEQVISSVEQRLRQFAHSARLPGFRPGKVPMKLLRQRYGAQLHEEALADLVRETLPDAIEQEELQPAAMPNVEFDIDMAGQRFAYVASFEIVPEIELVPLAGKSIKRPVCELSDADVDEMFETLRRQHRSWSVVERPCANGDQVTVSFTSTLDGETYEGNSASGLTLELGEERMMPAFEEGLIGASAGETRQIDVPYPEGHQVEMFAGKTVSFDVTLDSVAEAVLPEIDADFAKTLGVEDGDVERLRADVRTNMERELKQRLESLTKNSVMDLLFEAHPIELPKAMIEQEVAAMRHEFEQSLNGQSISALPDSLFAGGAHRRVALRLILGEIIRQNEIEVDEARLEQMLQEVASSYQDPQDVIKYYKANEQYLDSLRSAVLEGQVVDLVLEQLEVEDEPQTFKQVTGSDASEIDDEDDEFASA